MYLLKEKEKVENVFQNFYTMVLTQFQEKKLKLFEVTMEKNTLIKLWEKFFLKKGLCIKAFVRILLNRME